MKLIKIIPLNSMKIKIKYNLIKKYSISIKHKKEEISDFSAISEKKLAPYWVTGIVDAEGNFSVNKQKINKGYKYSLNFKVTQKNHSKGILLDIQKFFSCGNISIDNKKENTYKFSVNKINDIINIILPHFDKYPLLTSKDLDYLDFKKVAFFIKSNLHLKENYKNIIQSIKDNMNSKRSFEERWNFFIIKEKEAAFGIIKLKNEWVQAFIDGEGCFHFGIANTVNRLKSYQALTPTLSISQSNHSVKLLKAFINFFGYGYLKPKYEISLENAKASRSVNRYIINQSSTVISFVDKYPMLTRKHLDYLDWKTLIKLKTEKAYRNNKGRLLIKQIKDSMNSGRN